MSLSILPGLRRIIADPDIAIDLGTANTRLYALGRGFLADEPSIVKDSNLHSVSPLRAGVVEDIDAAVSLLKPLLERARRFGLLRPRALACAPTDATDKERA